MNEIDLTITPQQRRAAELLALGRKEKYIAEELEISPATVHDWKKLPGFIIYFTEIDREIRERRISEGASIKRHAERVLDEGVAESVSKLRELTRAADKDSTRLRAIVEVLDRAPQGPKRRILGLGSQRNTNIYIGIRQAENMRNTFEEIGDTKLLEMMEAEVQEVEEDGTEL